MLPDELWIRSNVVIVVKFRGRKRRIDAPYRVEGSDMTFNFQCLHVEGWVDILVIKSNVVETSDRCSLLNRWLKDFI